MNIKILYNKISFKVRIGIANILHIALVMSIFYGLVLSFIYSFLNKNFTSFAWILFSVVILKLVYAVIRPGFFEQFKNYCKNLSENMNKSYKEKNNNYEQIITSLEKLAKSENVYNSKLFNGIKYYFICIVKNLIYLKNKKLLKEIKNGLILLSKSKDKSQLHINILTFNDRVSQYKEFDNLAIAYPNIRNKKIALFNWELNKNMKPNPYIKIWDFFVNKGLIEKIVYAIEIIIFFVILKFIGVDWTQLIGLIK